MKIIRGALNAADVSNPNIRYNPDCDCLQVTPDGGTTWNDAPGLDPRHSPSFLKPPVAGSSKRCDAAANMVKWLHDFIDQMLFDFELVGSVTTIINSILLELQLLGPFAELLALVSELAETISALGGTALAAAFTSDQYDLLLCIFYCQADADGRIDADALARVQTDITAQLNTTAALITNAILSVQGEIGLSNAGAIGSETGDCSGCECIWCHTDDYLTSDGGGTASLGAWTEGLGWEAGVLDGGAGNAYTYIDLQTSIPAGSYTITEVRWAFTRVTGTFDSPITDRQWSPTEASADWYTTSPAGSTGSPWVFDPGLVDATVLGVTISSGYLAHSVAKSGNVIITRRTVYGSGDNPYITNNC